MRIRVNTDNQIEIELDNGNTIVISEVESGTIHLENTTSIQDGLDIFREGLGLCFSPIGRSIISITPEG